jgi:hypothetical protein
MRRFLILLVVCAVGLLPVSAFGAVTVSVEGTSLLPGGTAFVNVYIRSDVNLVEVLDAFSLVLQILPLNGDPLQDDVQFTKPPLDPQFSDPSYIFYLDSKAVLDPPPVTDVGTTAFTNDTYFGGDATSSELGRPIPDTDTLLATVQVNASATANIGDRFEISIVEGATVFVGPGPDFDEIPIFNLVSGIVVVTPEPSSIGMMGGLMLFALARVRVGRRKPAK